MIRNLQDSSEIFNVIPAKAGIHNFSYHQGLDSRIRGNDKQKCFEDIFYSSFPH